MSHKKIILIMMSNGQKVQMYLKNCKTKFEVVLKAKNMMVVAKEKKGEKLVVVEMDTNYKIMHYVCLNCKEIGCFVFCGDLRVKEGV